jgi:hypothetical protein
MSAPIDNETWIIDFGAIVIEKKATNGASGLSPLERLIYCLWVADYSMNNAGELETAGDVYAPFQQEAASLALELSLMFTHESFSLPKTVLQQQYYKRFDGICVEVRNALKA